MLGGPREAEKLMEQGQLSQHYFCVTVLHKVNTKYSDVSKDSTVVQKDCIACALELKQFYATSILSIG
jgi:hypothetical protein